MEFQNLSDEALSATLASIKDVPGTEDVQSAIMDAQAFRAANAEIIAKRAQNVTTCRALSEAMASVRHNEDASISDPTGTIFKNIRLALAKTLAVTFDVSIHIAEKMIMVLADESGQTNVGGNVEDAAAYVAAHPKSTVYSTQRPDDADKGTHASTNTLNAAVSAGEQASDDSKPSK
jgi:hypothetical protein